MNPHVPRPAPQERERRHRQRLSSPRRLGAVLLLATTLCVAACGSSNKSSGGTSGSSGGATSTASSSGGSGSSASSGLAKAKAQLAQYTAAPTWKPPGPSFNASKAKGKTIWFVVDDYSAVPLFTQMVDGMQAALKPLDISVKICDGKANPTQYVACMSEAISAKPGAIVIGAIDPATIAPSVAKANAAHIPIVLAAESNANITPPKGIQGVASFNYSLAGDLDADWAIVSSGGKANIFAPETTGGGDTPLDTLEFGAVPHVKQLCPGCQLTTKPIPLSGWGTQLGPLVATTLQKDPSVNYLLVQFDPMYSFIGPAISQAGFANKVKVSTFNGSLQQMQEMAAGSAIKMDVASDGVYLGYGTADQALRLMTGHPAVKNEAGVLRVYTASTVKSLTLTHAADFSNDWYGTTNFLQKFQQLWGLK